MVKLHVKRGDESQFLYESSTHTDIGSLLKDVVKIYNGRLNIQQLCTDLDQLSQYGIYIQPNMQGLAEEQIKDLKLTEEWSDKCFPTDGCIERKDPTGKRSGKAPNDKMAAVLTRTAAEARSAISAESVAAEKCLTLTNVTDILELLKGAVTIVYPMGLPSHDPISQILQNAYEPRVDLDIIDINVAQIWWAGKQLLPDKKLLDYVGKNEKTKLIVKLQKKDQGAPSRESALKEDERKQLMLLSYKRQEELKHLQQDDDDSYLNSNWADMKTLKTSLHGIQNVKWKPH